MGVGGGVGVGGGGIPSDYLVSTQVQLWLFCCWSCGYCWAVTKKKTSTIKANQPLHNLGYCGTKVALIGGL